MRLLVTLLAFAIAASAADLAGKWNFIWQTEGGERRSTIAFSSDKEKVSAQFPDAKGPIPGTFKNNKLALTGTLYSPEAGEDGAFQLSGELVGDQLRGTASWQGRDLTFTATRAN